MGEIWKNRDICFMDVERVYNEWMEKKIFILNSKILEHILTESLTEKNINDIKKLDDGFKSVSGVIKMKLVKTIVEKLGCLERPVYYLGNKGNSFHQVPSRDFFRNHFNDISVKFDYHVKMIVAEGDEENNDFKIKVKIELDGNPFINVDILVKFTGYEMSGKLSAKYIFDPADNFNLLVSDKNNGLNDEEDKEV